MAERIKTKRNRNLKNKFRFVILNDETFEEKFSLILTRFNVWIFLSVISFTLIFLTAAAIIYTPLKYFIPGFGDYNYRGQILQLQFETDSLQRTMQSRELWLQYVMDVASGNVDTSRQRIESDASIDKSKIKLTEIGEADKALRKEVEEEENFSLQFNTAEENAAVYEVRQMHLMVPVEGYVTEEFDPRKEHFGIDIAVKENAPVKTVLNGKVIATGYNLETGYVITVQHNANLVSIYKHNSRLFKKEGQVVKAGEVIAVAGNTGELSSGPHLHFELWHEGKSLNPRDYIVF